jgi:hypothetical protein
MATLPLRADLQDVPATQGIDPLEQFRVRGEKIKEELLHVGETFPLKSIQVAEMLGINPMTVRRMRVQRRLLAVSGAQGYLFPAWQFSTYSVLPGLAEVLNALEFKDEWTPLLFLCSGDRHLEGDTPLERLQAGDIGAVIAAASAYGQHNPA